MSDFDERMRELRERFIERARGDRAALARAAEQGDAAEARRIAHGLAGNGGLFGYPELSVAAAELEEALDTLAEASLPALSRALLDRLDQLA